MGCHVTVLFVIGKGEIIFSLDYGLFWRVTYFFPFTLGGLNFSSSQLPDNRTIKGFVEAYVEKFISGYPVAYYAIINL